jgi:hypothetical protein
MSCPRTRFCQLLLVLLLSFGDEDVINCFREMGEADFFGMMRGPAGDIVKNDRDTAAHVISLLHCLIEASGGASDDVQRALLPYYSTPKDNLSVYTTFFDISPSRDFNDADLDKRAGLIREGPAFARDIDVAEAHKQLSRLPVAVPQWLVSADASAKVYRC